MDDRHWEPNSTGRIILLPRKKTFQLSIYTYAIFVCAARLLSDFLSLGNGQQLSNMN